MLSVCSSSDDRIGEHPSSFSWLQFSMWHVIVLTIARDSITFFSCRGLMKEKVNTKANYRWHCRCRCRRQKKLWSQDMDPTTVVDAFRQIVSVSTGHQGPGHSTRTTSFGPPRPENSSTSGAPWWDPALGRYTVDVVTVDRMCISKSKLHRQSCQAFNRLAFFRANEERLWNKMKSSFRNSLDRHANVGVARGLADVWPLQCLALTKTVVSLGILGDWAGKTVFGDGATSSKDQMISLVIARFSARKTTVCFVQKNIVSIEQVWHRLKNWTRQSLQGHVLNVCWTEEIHFTHDDTQTRSHYSNDSWQTKSFKVQQRFWMNVLTF